MELSELSFKVNTEQLAAAVSLLGQVEQATNRLATAQKNQTAAATTASSANDSQAQSIKKLDTAQNDVSESSDKLQKSTKATASAADALGKSTEEASSKLKKLKKDSDDVGDSVDPLSKLIQNLKDKHLDLSRGFTSGESSVLKQARSYGALGDSLLPVIAELENIRKLAPNPFDAALGGVRSISSEFDKLAQRTKLASEGISLTDKQLSEYSRLANEISGKVIGMGLDPKAGEGLAIYNKALAESQSTYVSLAKSVNSAMEAERQLNTERRKAEREKIAADREAEKVRLKAEQDLVKSQENAQSALIDSLNKVSGLKAKSEQADAKLAIQIAKETAREQALIQEQVATNNAAAMKQRVSSMYATPLTSASSENKLQSVSDQGGYADSMARMKAFYTEQDKLMKASQGMNDQAVALFYKNQGTQAKGSDVVTKALREQERATKWLANEDERMVSVVNTLTNTQNLSNAASEKAARSIANYERNLRQAGVTGVEAAKSLDTYRKQQELIQTQEESRKGKFLSRALQPQIGDVVVSLAAGQNPLTVMLQQGDQVRGLIAQSGIEGAKLSAIMRAAFTDTLVSVKDTAKAMSQVLGGALLSVGKLVTDLAVGPIKAFTTSLEFSKAYGDSGGVAFIYAMKNAITALGASFAAFSTAGIVAVVAGLATMGVALYQVTKQEDEVSRVMVLHGASMGLTRGSAVALAQSFNGLGISTYKALDALSEMATVGGFVQADAQKVVDAAVKMEKAGGPAIAETVKMFSSIKDKPVEALIKLGEASGLIAPQILEEVSKLSITGHMGDAIALALDTAVGVVKKQTVEMTRELSTFGTLLKDIGNAWTTLMDKFRGSMYKDDVATVLQDKIDKLKSANQSAITRGIVFMVGGNTSNDIANLEEQLKLIKRTQTAEYDRNQETLAYNSKQSTLIKDKERLAKWLDDEEDRVGKKKLSREDFIAKALEDQVKKRGQLKDLTEQEQASIKRVAGLSFDKLHEKEGKSEESKYQTELKAALGLTDSVMNKDAQLLSETTKTYAAINFLRNKARKEDRISAADEASMLDALLNKQPFMVAARKAEADAMKEQADGLKLIDSLIGKADFMGSSYYETLKKLSDLEGKPGIDIVKLQQAKAALEKTTPAAKAFTSVMADYAKVLDDVRASDEALKEQYSSDFRAPDIIARVKSDSTLEKKKVLIEADYTKETKTNATKMDKEFLEQANKAARDVADAKIAAAQSVHDREVFLLSEQYKANKDYFDSLYSMSTGTGKLIGDEFAGFFTTGKSSFEGLTKSFGDMVNSMVADLIRLRIQKQVTGLFDQVIDSGGGFLSKLLPSLLGGSSVAAAAVGTSGTSAAMQGGFLPAMNALGGMYEGGIHAFAKGGSFTNSIVDSPTLFKFAKGTGMMGEAGPEAIMPLRRDASGSLGVVASMGNSSSSNVEVVINNFTSEKATATETVDSRGKRSISVTIGDTVAGELNRSGSASQSAMQSTYGMKPQLIRR